MINVTSIGLYPDVDQARDSGPATLNAKMVIADGTHNPPSPSLSRQAKSLGCRVADGLGILVSRGVIGIWMVLDRSHANAQAMSQALLDIRF
ncbi:hypothetical protein [Burkholderia cenocepacia]|uniref:hypothetical protein n=1 Tax=Burkholderia cenocepacia TaxID=95486 RepID=UPI000F584DAA|nr:hypothetical protein [Burkholderia cenocepacia]